MSDETAPATPAKQALATAAKRLGLEPHVLAGVKAWKRWDDLFDVSDAELLAATAEVANLKIGG